MLKVVAALRYSSPFCMGLILLEKSKMAFSGILTALQQEFSTSETSLHLEQSLIESIKEWARRIQIQEPFYQPNLPTYQRLNGHKPVLTLTYLDFSNA